MCINYRKLNTTTIKDYYHLPFIDQMMDMLVGHPHYCFLDGYSGYNQISIAFEDQDKSTSTCPYGTFAFRTMPFGLCDALATFQRCLMSMFSDLVEEAMVIFMDDFSVYGSSFKTFFGNFRNSISEVSRQEFGLKLGKMSFHGNRGYCL